MIDDTEVIGLTTELALAYYEKYGVDARIVNENGKPFMVTTDYKPGRRNLSIKNGKVIHIGTE